MPASPAALLGTRGLLFALQNRNSTALPKFEKGKSGNPAGRPRNEQAITPVLRRLLAEKRAGKTRAEWVANALLTAAEDGDQAAIRTLLERTDGKVLSEVDVTSGGQALKVTVTFDDASARD